MREVFVSKKWQSHFIEKLRSVTVSGASAVHGRSSA